MIVTKKDKKYTTMAKSRVAASLKSKADVLSGNAS